MSNVTTLPVSDPVAAIVADCRAKYPNPQIELVSVQTRVSLFVLRSPTAQEHRVFMASLRDDAMKGEATRNLFVTMCVYPEPIAVTSLVDRYGGVLAHPKVQNAIAWLTGQADELQGKSWPAP